MKRAKTAISPLCFLSNLYLALLFTLFLFWSGADGYVAIQEAKAACFYRLAGGYLALMALTALELTVVGKRKPAPLSALRRSSWVQRLVAGYWLFTVLSTLCSDFRQEAFWGMTRCEGLVTISLYCATFLCLSAFARPGRWMGWLLTAVMPVFAAVCLLQMAGRNPLGLYTHGLNYFDSNKQFAGIFLGTTGNAGLTAAVLCLTLPLLLGFALTEKGPLRLLPLAAAVLNGLVILRSDIQAGLVGMGLGLLLSAPMAFPKGSRKRRLCLYGVGAAMLCGVAAVLFYPGDSGLLYEVNQLLRGNFDPRFGNGRIHIWTEVLRMVPRHLWLGAGPDTMRALHLPGLTWYHAPSGDTIPLVIDIAHNEYLNILFHQGIFALAAYLAALALSAAKWLRTRRKAAAILGAGVLCYCIQAFFSFSMSAAAALFWAVWALLENQVEGTEDHT